MADIDALVSQIPIDQLAGQLGVSEAETEQAVRQALPALLGGMNANAQDPAGAASLARALGQHDDNLLEGGIDFSQVDTDDGQKIVKNVFGDNQDQVIDALGGLGGGGGGGGSIFAKLLPMLAPLVLSYLAKSFGGGGTRAGGEAEAGGMGGLGDILGGMLGGGQGGGDLGGLGDILGGLLGGGKR
ncbi:MAG: DUF937 domain-containing protein [Acidimicrobiales bacterium]